MTGNNIFASFLCATKRLHWSPLLPGHSPIWQQQQQQQIEALFSSGVISVNRMKRSLTKSAEEEKEDQFVRIESWKGGLSQQLASCECAMTWHAMARMLKNRHLCKIVQCADGLREFQKFQILGGGFFCLPASQSAIVCFELCNCKGKKLFIL